MDGIGNSFGWVATQGFYYGVSVLAIVSLPNPLAIIWLGIIIVGTVGYYLERKKHNGK